jgi:VWFA-related protein
MRFFPIILAMLSLALPASGQQHSLEEQIDVNAVLLDVIVTDSRGNHILGLSADDFIVKEDGVVQTIDSADYITNRTLLTAREDKAPFPVERVTNDRYFVFFFDKPGEPGALYSPLMLARQAVLDFIRKDMRPTDHVAIVGHDVRLKIYSDFTRDRRLLESALGEALRFGRGETTAGTAEGPSILNNMASQDLIRETSTVYEALDLLGDAMRPIPARKNLVLFSGGIADRHDSVRGGLLMGRSIHLDPALRSLNAANVSVYGVQLQRDVDATPMFHQRLTEISEATGGQYFQFNTSFRPAVRRIDTTNSGYYLVTYKSSRRPGESGFQKVEVAVKNPEFRVTARSGYQYGR